MPVPKISVPGASDQRFVFNFDDFAVVARIQVFPPLNSRMCGQMFAP
jgi:hypothetical protein